MKNIIECTSSELDYFTEKPYQNIIESGIYAEIPAEKDTSSVVTFLVGASPSYFDLSKSFVTLKLKIYKTKNVELKEDDNVGLVNNFFHSIFKQGIVQINEEEVENSNSMYAYRAYITDTLNHGSETKNTFLQNALYYHDTAGAMDSTELPQKISTFEDFLKKQNLNHGYLKRREILINGKGSIQVRGIPHLDIFHNDKFILNQTKLRIDLYLNDPSFYLMGSAGYQMEIVKAKLFVKKVQPNASIQNGINLQLEKSNAIYNMNHVYVKTIPVLLDDSAQEITICEGLVPKRIIIGLVNATASSSGNLNSNPFNFANFGLTSCTLQEGSSNVVYSNALEFDFDIGHYLDGYWSLFDGIDKPYLGNNISREDYAKGYMFLAYDLTPNGECEPFKTIDRSNKITARFKWNKKSEFALNYIIYLEFNKSIVLDKYRNIAK